MKSSISRSAAWLSILAVITYQLVLAALIFIRPDLDPSWHTISEWAIGPHGWITSAAFLVSALSYAAMFVLMRSHVRGVTGRIGLGLLGVCVVGAFGVGLFTTDAIGTPPSALSTTGKLHIVFGTAQLMLLPLAALLITLSVAVKNEAWLSARPVLLVVAGVPLLGFLGFAIYTALFVAPLGPGAYGPGVHIGWPPRFAFFTYAVWVVAVASQALRLHEPARQARRNEVKAKRYARVACPSSI